MQHNLLLEDSVFLSQISILLSLLAFAMAIYIAWGQHKQISRLERVNKNIDENVLGTLRGFGPVLHAMERYLQQSNEADSSNVYLMAYWFWFGADESDYSDIDEIDHNTSLIGALLKQRIVANKPTYLVLCDNPENITSFCRALFVYKGKSTNKDEKEFQLKVDNLVSRYLSDLDELTRLATRHPNLHVCLQQEVPALIFAVEGNIEVGIYYMGETPMLETGAQVGGFSSKNPPMVGMMVSQVQNAIIRRPNSSSLSVH